MHIYVILQKRAYEFQLLLLNTEIEAHFIWSFRLASFSLFILYEYSYSLMDLGNIHLTIAKSYHMHLV